MIEPLLRTVADLDQSLGGNANLLIAGGLGLFLKQKHLMQNNAKTLLPIARWPQARTTEDIDLFLNAEIVANAQIMHCYKIALKKLGFIVVENAKWMKFTRKVEGQEVLIDLMVGPLGKHESLVERRGIRVKPIGTSGLHARFTIDALAIEQAVTKVRLQTEKHDCNVLVPESFPFAMMKLGAFQDRVHDERKDEGRHHALDLYRIIAMLTPEESENATKLAKQFTHNLILNKRLNTIKEMFVPKNGVGRIRLQEHPLCPKDVDLGLFVEELLQLLQ
ncbi:hypothetical protein H8D29_01305 [PVC group bacterium]|nr:hypothetical protein [PVC group bacterium]